jgi:hypothetical protein
MISPTRMRGFSEPYGSWNTICICARSSRNAAPDAAPTAQRHAAGRRLDQSQHGLAGGGLATAGFADQRQRAPGADIQRHAIDRAHVAHRALQDAAADREVHLQLAHAQQRLRLARLRGFGGTRGRCDVLRTAARLGRVVQVATHLLPVARRLPGRRLIMATGPRLRAALGEAATAEIGGQRRHRAADGGELAPP